MSGQGPIPFPAKSGALRTGNKTSIFFGLISPLQPLSKSATFLILVQNFNLSERFEAAEVKHTFPQARRFRMGFGQMQRASSRGVSESDFRNL